MPLIGFGQKSDSKRDPEQWQQLVNVDEEIPAKRQTLLKRRLQTFVLLLISAVIFLVFGLNYINKYNRCALAFEEFKIKFKRNYTVDEERFRYGIFWRNMFEWEAEERRLRGVLDLDVTQFADHTEDELFSRLMPAKEPSNASREYFPEATFLEGFKRPESFDWRKRQVVTPVKNQQACGSCWSFATVATVESAIKIKKNVLYTLSEQELVDCVDEANGCNGGSPSKAFHWIRENGLSEERFYPYIANDINLCQTITGNLTNRIKIDDYKLLPSDEDWIADWVAKKGPVEFDMHVTKSLFPYRSGIYHPTDRECDRSPGMHALAIVGYGSEDGRPFWWVKNSWGDDWGINGYFKLARGHNVCGMAVNVYAPIVY